MKEQAERVGKTGKNNPKPTGEIRLGSGMYVTEFQPYVTKEFTLADVFQVELSNSEKMNVVLQEDAVIKALDTDPRFYTLVGPEFCLLFDIMYAKSGTESVAESFYRVVENQEMDGGQSIEVLAARSKVDWCLPAMIQCESTLGEMAKLYINGSKEDGLKKHHVPVYRDSRSQKGSDKISKVVDRIKKSTPRLPFLL